MLFGLRSLCGGADVQPQPIPIMPVPLPCSEHLRSDYQIIYSDPAWSYTDKAHAGKRGAGHKYRCTTTEEMSQWDVSALCAPNATLFMWATMPMLPDALDLMRAWGFQYKTVAFVWHKLTKNGKSHFGMGNWTRANCEMVLLGVCGKPKRLCASVRQFIEHPVMEHSVKPAIFRESVLALMGRDLPRLEMFARCRSEGWDAWGDQLSDAPAVRE
jgi:site-specific DNA-methyltransferase (adenine-specific)